MEPQKVLQILLYTVTDPDALASLAHADNQGAWEALLRLGIESDGVVDLARGSLQRIDDLRRHNMTTSARLATDDFSGMDYTAVEHLDLKRVPTPILLNWQEAVPIFDGVRWCIVAEELVRRRLGIRLRATSRLTRNMSENLQRAILTNNGTVFGLEYLHSTADRRRTWNRFVHLMDTTYSHDYGWSIFLHYVRDFNAADDGGMVARVVERHFWKAYECGDCLDISRRVLNHIIQHHNTLACHFLLGRATADDLMHYRRYHAAAKAFGIFHRRLPPRTDDPFACLFETVDLQTVLFNRARDHRARLMALERCIGEPGVFYRVMNDNVTFDFRCHAIAILPENLGLEMTLIISMTTIPHNQRLIENVIAHIHPSRLPVDFMRHQLEYGTAGWEWVINLVQPSTHIPGMFGHILHPDAADAVAHLIRDEDEFWGSAIQAATQLSEKGWSRLAFEVDLIGRYDHPLWWRVLKTLPRDRIIGILDFLCSLPSKRNAVKLFVIKELQDHPRVVKMVKESSIAEFVESNMHMLEVHDRFRAVEAALYPKK